MKILIAHDGSAFSDLAIEDMRRAGLPQGAKAFVACIADSAKAVAAKAGDRIQAHFPKWEIASEPFAGSPAEIILKTSIWWRPDLLIIGSGAFALERSMASSVPLDVVHRAQCSVRVVRSGGPAATGRIRLVIGSNGSKTCEAVVHEVARRQWPENTETHVISVVESAPPGDENDRIRLRALDEECLSHLRGAGLTVNRRFIGGDPRHELVRESERCNADTIFVGPRQGRGIGRFLLGTVATAVVTRARSTVEVVRPN